MDRARCIPHGRDKENGKVKTKTSNLPSTKTFAESVFSAVDSNHETPDLDILKVKLLCCIARELDAISYQLRQKK
jgi:hypothetical protein